jgi:hypothetical protein
MSAFRTESHIRGGGHLARVVIFFIAVLAAFLLPVGLALYAMAFAPPPYILTAEIQPAWFSGLNVGAGHVTVHRLNSPENARRMTRHRLNAIKPSYTASSFDGVARYTYPGGAKAGMLFPVENFSVEITAGDEAAVNKVAAALPFVKENPAPSLAAFIAHHVGGTIGIVLAYTALVGVGMARGASWATTMPPAPRSSPAARDELRERILDINKANVPFRIRAEGSARLVAEWILADARWTHLVQRSGLRRIERLILDLDETTHQVRVLAQSQTTAKSGGLLGLWAALNFWQGIRFAQLDIEKGGGITFSLQNGWQYHPGYRYRFDAAEMKAPLAAAVTRSGWTWKPVVTLLRPIGG